MTDHLTGLFLRLMSVRVKDRLVLFHDNHSNIIATKITHRDTK